MKDYSQYSQEDFIMDPKFQDWIKSPVAESDSFWNGFIEKYPHKKNDVIGARTFLSSALFTDNLSFTEKEYMWRQVNSAVQKEKEGKLIFMQRKQMLVRRRIAFSSAAILLFCVGLLGVKYFSASPKEKLVATQYGEIKEIRLPDSSIITLNAHSSLNFKQWNANAAREVWIDGEAFFSVKHKLNNQAFIVHTKSYDVEVLGTEFNVMQREDRLKVSLNSGRIKLKDHKDASQDVLMLPGDVFELTPGNKSLQKHTGSVANISAWKTSRLVLDDTPLSEIMMQLNYVYGWEFSPVEKDLLNEKLTGELDTRNEQSLINTLEKGFSIKITRQGKNISITRM